LPESFLLRCRPFTGHNQKTKQTGAVMKHYFAAVALSAASYAALVKYAPMPDTHIPPKIAASYYLIHARF